MGINVHCMEKKLCAKILYNHKNQGPQVNDFLIEAPASHKSINHMRERTIFVQSHFAIKY